jgi:hypothetical protein
VQSSLQVIETELNRVSIRVTGLNVSRLEAFAPRIHRCAQAVVQLTPESPDILPSVGITAAIAQLNVVVKDYLATNSPESNYEVAALLTQLRRDLP